MWRETDSNERGVVGQALEDLTGHQRVLDSLQAVTMRYIEAWRTEAEGGSGGVCFVELI